MFSLFISGIRVSLQVLTQNKRNSKHKDQTLHQSLLVQVLYKDIDMMVISCFAEKRLKKKKMTQKYSFSHKRKKQKPLNEKIAQEKRSQPGKIHT